ncbi:MAG: hypothetical protein D6805_07680, partial [Planctomycetota bacterium]
MSEDSRRDRIDRLFGEEEEPSSSLGERRGREEVDGVSSEISLSSSEEVASSSVEGGGDMSSGLVEGGGDEPSSASAR